MYRLSVIPCLWWMTGGTSLPLYGQCDNDACKGPNLIMDGNFEQSRPGALLFETDYTYVECPPTTYQSLWGRITLQRDPGNCYPLWTGADHTFGDTVGLPGQMLVVDFPNNVLHLDIWRDQVVVEPGATYCFGAWCRNLNVGANVSQPAFRFVVNGVSIGTSPDLPTQGDWAYYSFTYTVPANETVLQIAIQNAKQGGNGNDMAVDDIEFRKLLLSGVKPIAADDVIPIPANSGAYPLPLLANDNPGSLSYPDLEIIAWPDSAGGSLHRDPLSGQPLFTPQAGFDGVVHVKYRVCHPSGCCSEAIAALSVEQILPAGSPVTRQVAAQAADWTVYPNPAGPAGVTLAFGQPESLPRQVALFDATGRLCQQVTVPAEASQHLLPTAGLAPGLYFLRLSGNASATRRLLLLP